MTVRQGIRLADGRELFYYDRTAGRDRSAPDRRDGLPVDITSSEVRWNPLFRDYTVIAGHRQTRTYKPPPDLCPLCPSRDTTSTEIPADDYEVAVFENRFPSFALQSIDSVRLVDPPPFQSGPGAGRCEVVCFTSDHNQSFAQLSPEHARTVIDAWADRSSALSSIESIDYVFCFENRGEEIGVTLSHPHGQIYGYPFVPPRFFRAGESARRHRDRVGTCLQCDLLESELKADLRIVSETAHWVSYVPFAARWPYEVRVVPREHVPDLAALSDGQRDDLAGMVSRCVAPLRRTVRHARALHRRLAAGAGTARSRRLAPRRRDLHHPAGTRQAEVPRRFRVGCGHVDQRHRPGNRRRAVACGRRLANAPIHGDRRRVDIRRGVDT